MPVTGEFMGLAEDAIIDRLANGESIAGVCSGLGCDRATLSRWLNADPQRSARAREARELGAAAWDDKAEEGIAMAADPFELSRAKELAHHYRWRASKIAPKQYGDKLQHSGDAENPVGINVNIRTF